MSSYTARKADLQIMRECACPDCRIFTRSGWFVHYIDNNTEGDLFVCGDCFDRLYRDKCSAAGRHAAITKRTAGTGSTTAGRRIAAAGCSAGHSAGSAPRISSRYDFSRGINKGVRILRRAGTAALLALSLFTFAKTRPDFLPAEDPAFAVRQELQLARPLSRFPLIGEQFKQVITHRRQE